MRVLFIHPAHPSQFTDTAHFMSGISGVETAVLTDETCMDEIRDKGAPVPYFGYRPDTPGAPSLWYATGCDDGFRHGKAVCDALPGVMSVFPADIVVGHASFGTTFFLKNMYRIPVVSYVELPGYHMAWCRKEYPPLAEHLFLNSTFQALVYTSAVNSDRVVVPSYHAARHFPEELHFKIRVQMEGFNLPELFSDKRKLRKKYGIDEAGPVIGFASRTLEAMRGFDIFLEAAFALRKLCPDLKLLVIGTEKTIYGNELSYLNGSSFKQHCIDRFGIRDDFIIWKEFLGYSEFHEHLQTMDLIMFPLFEGAANWGLFEAMASGVPVIASDRCFIPEVIEHGINGFMFDPYDIEGIVNKAFDILKRPELYASVGINARNTIQTRFSVQKSVMGYLGIFEEILK